MEYQIVLYANKKPEGYFWYITTPEGANRGYGWESTLNKAFAAAKKHVEYLEKGGAFLRQEAQK